MNEISRGEKRKFIDQVIEDLGHRFVIAALAEGMGGSCSHIEAERIVDRFIDGEDNEYSERCIALFEYDLVAMLFEDVWSFLDLTEGEQIWALERCDRALTLMVQEGGVTFLGRVTEP